MWGKSRYYGIICKTREDAMNRLMDKKAKTVFLITLCSAMLIVHAFARFGTSFFKTEMSRTQDELEEMAESGIRETKEKYAGMISSLKTL